MIVSKPKTNTLFSVSIFIAIAFGLAIYGATQAIQSNSHYGWHILSYTSGPIGLLVLIKILTGLKTLKVAKEKFELKMPFKFKKAIFHGKEISKWTHTAIKTYGGLYEELIWEIGEKKQYSISKQENTEFDKVLKYMKKKYKKLEASSTDID